jgi:DNA adenine methylase Dam
MASGYIESPVFLMGNKYKLLKYIIPLFPNKCGVFLDAFGGSGVVSLNYTGGNKTIYNEYNPYVIGLVNMIIEEDIDQLNQYYLECRKKYNLRDKSEKENFKETEGDYYKLRDDYNNSEKSYKDLYFLMCYSINHLLRFNSDGDFNISAGSDSYNELKFNALKRFQARFKDVEVSNKDFFDLDLSFLTEDDFVYLDTPYTNTLATYNEDRKYGGWDIDKDMQVFKILEELHNRKVKWAYSNVFTNRGKTNQHIIDWATKNNWNIQYLERNYNPLSKGNSDSQEVLVTNYTKFLGKCTLI